MRVEVWYTPSEWLLIEPEAPHRGGFYARLTGAYAEGVGHTAHEALVRLESELREWVRDWDADSYDYGYPALDNAKDRVNQYREPPLVSEVRKHLSGGCLLAVLEASAAGPVLASDDH
jgi:hypothetical protein